MREILFKGKRKDNGEWVEGYYVYDDSGQVTEKPTAYIYHLNTHPCGWHLIQYEVIPETVRQYTGLTDKNGKKIFEGDIVKRGFDLFVVKWSENQCRYDIYINDYVISGFNRDTMLYFEVIGNTTDNPELLKGGKQE